jgi:type IV pilus assembly protein PilV
MLKNNRKHQLGLGLIESLIALLVISIGLLGVAALQITSLKQSSSAQNHSQAVWYSYEMTDRINANRGAILQYVGIDTANTYDKDCQGSPCSPSDMVTADAQIWKNLVSKLPSGRGVITQPNAGVQALQVTVMWDDGADESNCTNGEPNSNGMTCYTVTIQ